MIKSDLFTFQPTTIPKVLSIVLIIVLCTAALPLPAFAMSPSTLMAAKGTFTAKLHSNGNLDIVGSGFRVNGIFVVRVQTEKQPWDKIGTVKSNGSGKINATVKAPDNITKSKHKVNVCLKDKKTGTKVCIVAAKV
jgi:hypothetical protein